MAYDAMIWHGHKDTDFTHKKWSSIHNTLPILMYLGIIYNKAFKILLTTKKI